MPRTSASVNGTGSLRVTRTCAAAAAGLDATGGLRDRAALAQSGQPQAASPAMEARIADPCTRAGFCDAQTAAAETR
ncbi:hypothetical protein E4Q08_13995 [Candidatus Accumulibacter phosphatis]|uniref:Uncharacterized protein n=1 Tax=Candidatus Accumulibacter contiguus TaxID=2954381 RepID=A0ABX1TDF2_9PROT|nr:hypothetical protein [Candidatus Accumulibacter contiguus]NMQ06282.1 hypothetical protein [Candidatus Accumulibacter contiguus]